MEHLCNVRRITYEPVNRTGEVILDEHGCADMSGAIELFIAIDPDVRKIQASNSDGQTLTSGTVYRRNGNDWNVSA